MKKISFEIYWAEIISNANYMARSLEADSAVI